MERKRKRAKVRENRFCDEYAEDDESCERYSYRDTNVASKKVLNGNYYIIMNLFCI